MTIYIFMYLMFNYLMIMIMIYPSNLLMFNPLILSLLLILYVIVICLKINFMQLTFWFSYVLFLVMVGGLMILFMYFTSLSMNQLYSLKMNFYLNLFMKLFMVNLIMLMMFYNKEWLYEMLMYELNLDNYFFLMKKFNKVLYMNLMLDLKIDLTLYMIFYLFLMMVCSVLICFKVYTPLRQLNLN